MLTKIKSIMTALVVPIMMLAPVAITSVVNADTVAPCSTVEGNLNAGVNNAFGTSGCSDSSSTGTSNIGTVAKNIVNILSLVIGIVAVIMIIVGGFRYIISGGESNGVSSAKNTLIYAIIGLVIVVLAQIIVHFVINTANTAAS